MNPKLAALPEGPGGFEPLPASSLRLCRRSGVWTFFRLKRNPIQPGGLAEGSRWSFGEREGRPPHLGLLPFRKGEGSDREDCAAHSRVKSEGRRSKAERSPKPEPRRPKQMRTALGVGFRSSDFGTRPSFGLRPSGFGLQSPRSSGFGLQISASLPPLAGFRRLGNVTVPRLTIRSRPLVLPPSPVSGALL